MDQDQLIKLFDEVWADKLCDAINQAKDYDVKEAFGLLSISERAFFDFNQKHRKVYLQDEGLDFIAQIRTIAI